MKRLLVRLLANLLLVVVSISIGFAGLELFLRAEPLFHTPAAAISAPSPRLLEIPPPESGSEIRVPDEILAKKTARPNPLILPDAWKKRDVKVPGAYAAHYWHGVLFVQNADGMRWILPFPEKRADTYRVMVVGDSLTYGYGLPEEDRFSSLLNDEMGRDFRIEFINLGVPGHQSEDILRVIRKYLPILQPDLVLYAICLNDFLPSGRGQYANDYNFPLPETIKSALIAHTRAGAFLSDAYDRALRRLHLRGDFFDDILRDFEGYQQRFGRDVQEINSAVRQAGLPPLVGLVVDQFPEYGGRGYRIAHVAEHYLTQAGAEVIPTENFYRAYHGRQMYISKWEGHPDEVANSIWATMISRHLRAHEDIQAFRR